MATRTRTHGLTINGETGWSSISSEPNMSTLLRNSESELWACTAIPHTVHYSPNRIVVQPDNAYLPWKRRTFNVAAPSYEATRFRVETHRS